MMLSVHSYYNINHELIEQQMRQLAQGEDVTDGIGRPVMYDGPNWHVVTTGNERREFIKALEVDTLLSIIKWRIQGEYFQTGYADVDNNMRYRNYMIVDGVNLTREVILRYPLERIRHLSDTMLDRIKDRIPIVTLSVLGALAVNAQMWDSEGVGCYRTREDATVIFCHADDIDHHHYRVRMDFGHDYDYDWDDN
jgi:hypothetical protein